MAFSTQKDFLKIGFLNDYEDFNREDRKRHRVSLKSYTSCTDSRAWSLSPEKQARYLKDLVACGSRFDGDGDSTSVEGTGDKESGDKAGGSGGKSTSSYKGGKPSKKPVTSSPSHGAGTTSDKTGKGDDGFSGGEHIIGHVQGSGSGSGNQSGDKRPVAQVRPNARPGSPNDESDPKKGASVGPVKPVTQIVAHVQPSYIEYDKGASKNATSDAADLNRPSRHMAASNDSLIEAACMKLDEINAIIRENNELKNRLRHSEEKVEKLGEENHKIKSIVSETATGSMGPLEDELKVLKAKGELNTENVLKVFKTYIDGVKAQSQKADVIKAENESLKRQLELLETRVKISVIPEMKETSTDVNYLQTTMNDLRNELKQLRAIEEDRARLKVEFDKLKDHIKGIGSPDDLYNMKKATVAIRDVKCDRDRLRGLINSMVGIEGDLRKLKERAERADQLEKQMADLKDGKISATDQQNEIDRLRKELGDSQNKLNSVLASEADLGQIQDQLKDYDKMSCELQLYKMHYNELMNELRRVSGKVLQLEPELEDTKYKLSAAESAITAYERQMDELMAVIRELEEQRHQQTRPSNMITFQDGHIQDLLAAAKIVIILIQKEAEARQSLEDELKKCKAEIGKKSDNMLDSKKDISKDVSTTEDLDALKDKLKLCQKKLEELKKENELLKGELSNEDVQGLLDQLVACKRENDRLEKAIGSQPGDKDPKFESQFEDLNRCKGLLNSQEAEKKQLNDKISELEKLLEQCKKGNEVFAELQKKETALDDCQKKLQDLENQVAKLTNEMDNCRNEVGKMGNHISEEKEKNNNQIAEEQKHLDETDQAQAAEFDKCRKELDELKKQLAQEAEKCLKEKEQWESQLNKLTQDQNKMDGTKDVVSDDIINLKKLLEDCKRENNVLKGERENLANQLNECKENNEKELSKLRGELSESLKACENAKATLSDQLAKANDEVKNLNTQLEQKTVEGGSSSDDCEKAKAALKDCLEKYKQLESRYDSLQQHDASIQKALDDLRKEYEAKTLDWAKELNEQKSLLEAAKSQLETQRAEISRLNGKLQDNSCKDLEAQLANLAAENNKLKADNDKLNQQVKAKENEISNLNQKLDDFGSKLSECEKAIPSTDCSKYIDEIGNLKSTIAKHLDEIEKQRAALDNLRAEVDATKAAKSALESEISKIKADKEAANQALRDEINKLKTQLSTGGATDTPQKLPPQSDTEERLRLCLEEKGRLQNENKRLQDEFQQLERLVKDIEEERKKNKELESLVESLGQKIKALQEQPSPVLPEKPGINVQDIVDRLKAQLQAETDKNNTLSGELQTCKQKLDNCLKELEAGKAKLNEISKQPNITGPSSSTPTVQLPTQNNVKNGDNAEKVAPKDETIVPPKGDTIVAPKDSTIVPPKNDTIVAPKESNLNGKPKDPFSKTISEMQTSHCENLEKMQKLYEERMQEMMKNHDKEIQSLRMTNEALRKMLLDIKSQIAAIGGNAGKETPKIDDIKEKLEESESDVCGQDKKLNKICTKIIKSSINCLSLRELKYLHCAVYRAGVKMKPMVAVESEDIGRCCQCTGFVCSLPSIPKDAEKKFIERINCLENELENANGLLQRLRDRYDSRSSCNRRCCAGLSDRRAPPRGINDAVNQILKCARESGRNSGN